MQPIILVIWLLIFLSALVVGIIGVVRKRPNWKWALLMLLGTILSTAAYTGLVVFVLKAWDHPSWINAFFPWILILLFVVGTGGLEALVYGFRRLFFTWSPGSPRLLVRTLVFKLIGKVSWQPPGWVNKGPNKVLSRLSLGVRKNWRKCAAVGVLIVAAILAFVFWPQPPEPLKLSATITSPSPPPPRKASAPEPRPAPVVLHFSGSAAPLEAIGKAVTAGIKMQPPVNGEWRWDGDKTLRFSPKEHWPVGKSYRVSIEKSVVADHILLSEYTWSFSTEPFRATIAEIEFHQDPVDPHVKKVVSTIRFNYPVDPKSFESNVSMMLIDTRSRSEQPFRFIVTYDDLKFEAYVHSAIIEIPLEDQNMRVAIAKGIVAQAGGDGTTSGQARDVRIPGRYNLFQIQDASITLVRNERYEPEQVVVVNCTTGVLESRLADNISAYLLPINKPAAQGQQAIKNYYWGNPQEIGPEILKASKKIKLDPIPAEREYAIQHTFKIDAEPNRSLYIKVNKGIEAYGGYILARDFDTIVYTPEYPKEVQIMHAGAILSVSGERRLNVMARGLPAVRVELDRILPKDLNHLLSQSSGDFKSPYFQNYSFNEINISEVFTEVRKLDASDPKRAQYTAVDFGPYLNAGDVTNRGLFILKVQAWDPDKNQPQQLERKKEYRVVGSPSEGGDENQDDSSGEEADSGGEGEDSNSGYRGSSISYDQASDRRFILVTDLGLIIKTDAENNNLVFVQSIKTGEPIGDAVVEVLGRNGVPVLSRRTDATGLASFPTLKDFTAEKQPVAYVVRRGADLSFLPVHRGDRLLNFSRFDVGGVKTRGQADALSAFLFSDRGLYRPGDTFHIGMIVKPVDWTRSVLGVPIQIVIADARGLEVKKFRLDLPESGFSEVSYTTEESAPTGTYTVSAFIVQDDQRKALLGSTTVRIEEFLPDRLRITSRFLNALSEGWIAPAGVKARVDLSNLFGTPAVGHKIAASMTMKPRFPVFRGYRDYTFYDPLRAENSYEQRLSDETTDDNGSVTFELDLKNMARATFQLDFFSQGFELDGGRGVSSEISTLVSPLQFIVGYKPEGELNYIKKGSEHYVEFIAVDPTLKKIKAEKLTAVVVEQRYVSVLMRQTNGTYKYQSVLKDITRDQKPFHIDASGTNYRLPTQDPGDFIISIRDASDVELNRVRFSVAGEANLTRQLDRNAELIISLDRKDYAAGDTIEIQIKAPYVGAGLITIERDRVYAHKWFKTTTTASVQTIKLPPGLEGNGYINVEFVRGLNSEEIFMSPLSYGIAPFSISRKARTIEISLDATDMAKPGEPLSIGFKTDRPSKIVVFAVDEGILQVAKYQTPDPAEYFLSKRALEVSTRQILDLLLPEYSVVRLLSKGGGDEALEAIAKNLNPFKRKRDKPVVFWSGITDAGTESRTVTYTIPDYFNGTLRVMAVAISADAMGSSSKKTTVRGPFVISPNTPLFLAPGDTFEASAAVANNVEGSGKDAKVQVSLAVTGGLEIQGNATQELPIPEAREGIVRFKLKVKPELGNAELKYVAKGAKNQTAMTATLSVRPPTPYITTLKSGSVKNSSVDIAVDRKLYTEHARLEVVASPLPLSLARGLAVFLESYPHLCTEQLVSATVPALVLSSYPALGYDSKRTKEALERTFTILQARQNNEGAFGFWAANSHVSDFQVVYAMHFLTEAHDRGFAVPGDMRSKGLMYLREMVRRSLSSLSDGRLRAYAIYVLARNGQLSTSELAELMQFLKKDYAKTYQKDIVAVYVAGSYQIMRDAKEAQRAIKAAEVAVDVALDEATFYDTQAYLAQYLYVVSRHFPERLHDIETVLIERIAKGIDEQRYNTLSSALSIFALDAYAKAVTGTPQGTVFKEVHLSELRDKNEIVSLNIGDGLFPMMSFSHQARAIRLANKSTIPIFYAVTVAGFDLFAPKDPLKNGLEIIHSYENDSGSPVNDVNIGDLVNVRIKVRTIERNHASNVALVDLLPAGFDVVIGTGEQRGVAGRLATNGSGWQPDYADIREDRVILYGGVNKDVSDFVYKIRAVARGSFQIPPTFVEAMYDRTLQARSLGAHITVAGE
jgi:uncharacterized protein YfaS (alpha-2-macroglobulin family)